MSGGRRLTCLPAAQAVLGDSRGGGVKGALWDLRQAALLRHVSVGESVEYG